MATVLPPLKDTPMSPPPMSLRQDSHQGNCPDLRITEYMVEDLWQMIKKSSDYGATPDTIGGMSRLALTEDDASFRAWFKDEALSMGCEVRVDRVGNMFAVLPGRNRSLPPIGIGSHLDTQPCGGRFDGILGVLAGLEVIKAMNAFDHKPWADIAVINWTNEEGANYTAGCTGSAVWSHHITLESALAMPRFDHQSTFGDDLRAIGYDGPYIPSYQANPLSAHFELHIEQGVELEREAKQIGIVSGIQGIRWYMVEVHGVRAHAGSTCMGSRADAVVAASKMVCYIDELSRLHKLFGTVGKMEIPQASSNVVSGFVRFTIDLRHREECRLTEVEAAMYARMDDLRSENPHINFHMRQIWHSPAAKFDRHALKMVRESAMHIVGEKAVKDEMLSHAGHDSALVHLAGVPTAMIFVPSRGGISHAPGEFTSRAQCGIGLKVMYATVNAFDRWLESRDSNL